MIFLHIVFLTHVVEFVLEMKSNRGLWTSREKFIIIVSMGTVSFLLSGISYGNLAFRQLLIETLENPLSPSLSTKKGYQKTELINRTLGYQTESYLCCLFVRTLIVSRFVSTPIGYAVDTIGPRIVCMAGTLIVTLGFIIMASVSSFQASYFSSGAPLLTIGFILLTIGGQCIHMAALCLPLILYDHPSYHFKAASFNKISTHTHFLNSRIDPLFSNLNDGSGDFISDHAKNTAETSRRWQEVAIVRLIAFFTCVHTISPIVPAILIRTATFCQNLDFFRSSQVASIRCAFLFHGVLGGIFSFVLVTTTYPAAPPQLCQICKNYNEKVSSNSGVDGSPESNDEPNIRANSDVSLDSKMGGRGGVEWKNVPKKFWRNNFWVGCLFRRNFWVVILPMTIFGNTFDLFLAGLLSRTIDLSSFRSKQGSAFNARICLKSGSDRDYPMEITREDSLALDDFCTLLPLSALITITAVTQATSVHKLSFNAIIVGFMISFWIMVITFVPNSRYAHPLSLLAFALLRPYFFSVANQIGSRITCQHETGRTYGYYGCFKGIIFLFFLPLALPHFFSPSVVRTLEFALPSLLVPSTLLLNVFLRKLGL